MGQYVETLQREQVRGVWARGLAHQEQKRLVVVEGRGVEEEGEEDGGS